eukprot:gene6673-8005_t
MSSLHRSSNRLLGIFPVPEEHSNSLADSALSASPCASPAPLSAPVVPAVGIAGRESPRSSSSSRIAESIFGASALLNPLDYTASSLNRSVSSGNVNSSTSSSTSSASASAAPSVLRRPPVATSTSAVSLPAWATQDPLCASAYSDCGQPLPR